MFSVTQNLLTKLILVYTMRIFLLLIMTCIVLPAYAQKALDLKAIAMKDTIVLGESIKIRLSLNGVESDIFDTSLQRKKSIFDDFYYKVPKNDNSFSTVIEVTPISIGKSIFGPYEITLLGETFTSNEVPIHVLKQYPEYINIEMPSNGVLGKQIDIKISCESIRPFAIQLLDNEMFKIEKQSNSSRIINGEFTRETIFTVTLTKKGSFILDKTIFANLPKHVLVEPVNFKTK